MTADEAIYELEIAAEAMRIHLPNYSGDRNRSATPHAQHRLNALSLGIAALRIVDAIDKYRVDQQGLFEPDRQAR